MVASPLPFRLETQRKRCPHLLPCAWSLEGSQTPLSSLLCRGRGWHPFLLTSDDSEPYFPKVAEESGGAGRPSQAPGPGGVTGISCPFPTASAPHFPGTGCLPPAYRHPPGTPSCVRGRLQEGEGGHQRVSAACPSAPRGPAHCTPRPGLGPCCLSSFHPGLTGSRK